MILTARAVAKASLQERFDNVAFAHSPKSDVELTVAALVSPVGVETPETLSRVERHCCANSDGKV